MKKNQNHGFTLIEIIVVILIIGILAGVALPRMSGAVERTRAAEGVSILTALLGAQKSVFMETGAYTANLANLDVTIDRADNFSTASIVVQNNAANVASIQRLNGAQLEYTLSINENGVIACVNGPNISCAKAGH